MFCEYFYDFASAKLIVFAIWCNTQKYGFCQYSLLISLSPRAPCNILFSDDKKISWYDLRLIFWDVFVSGRGSIATLHHITVSSKRDSLLLLFLACRQYVKCPRRGLSIDTPNGIVLFKEMGHRRGRTDRYVVRFWTAWFLAQGREFVDRQPLLAQNLRKIEPKTSKVGCPIWC